MFKKYYINFVSIKNTIHIIVLILLILKSPSKLRHKVGPIRLCDYAIGGDECNSSLRCYSKSNNRFLHI